MGKVIFISVVCFIIGAITIATLQLSTEAQAVVVGAVFGIGAAIPVSIALVIGATKNFDRPASPTQSGISPYQVNIMIPTTRRVNKGDEYRMLTQQGQAGRLIDGDK